MEEDYCLSSIYGNVINCFMELYSYDEAIEKGEQYIEGPTDKLVKAVIAGRLAIAFVDKENYEKALRYTEFYWKVYQEYLKNRDAFMTFDTPVTNTCFHERKRTPVLGNGVRAAVRCGMVPGYELAVGYLSAGHGSDPRDSGAHAAGRGAGAGILR